LTYEGCHSWLASCAREALLPPASTDKVAGFGLSLTRPRPAVAVYAVTRARRVRAGSSLPGISKEKHISEPRINDRIRVPEVRLVGPNGEQVGIVRVEDALRLAAEADLDLVEVAPMAKPPVAKLMDFGKFKYEAAMKAREARKNQVNTVIKEIKLRPKIDPHDYGTKKGHVERFLKGGDKVKVTIMFRGREQSRPELGYRLLQRLAQDIAELGIVESAPKQDGRNMVMVIAPTKKKAQAMAEQRRRRDEGSAAASAPEQSIEAEVREAEAFVAPAPSSRPRPRRRGRPGGRGPDVAEAAPLPRSPWLAEAAPAPAAEPRHPPLHRHPRRQPPSRCRDPQAAGRGTEAEGRPEAAGDPEAQGLTGPEDCTTEAPAPQTRWNDQRKEIGTMPKNKTHSGAKKRFRVTGSGKVMREQAGHVHKFHEKTPQKARALSKDVLVSKGDLKKVKKLLGR
jgi:translation initiation factor IF-3